MKVKTVRYLKRTPESLPAGEIVAHNQARIPEGATPNQGGWRIWTAKPDEANGYEVVECGCGWLPGIGPHYRVSRT